MKRTRGDQSDPPLLQSETASPSERSRRLAARPIGPNHQAGLGKGRGGVPGWGWLRRRRDSCSSSRRGVRRPTPTPPAPSRSKCTTPKTRRARGGGVLVWLGGQRAKKSRRGRAGRKPETQRFCRELLRRAFRLPKHMFSRAGRAVLGRWRTRLYPPKNIRIFYIFNYFVKIYDGFKILQF
jgi:hypothetical protein